MSQAWGGGVMFEDMLEPYAGGALFEDILEPYDGGALFEDMREPSPGEVMFEDMLLSSAGGVVYEEMLEPCAGGARTDLQGLPTTSFLEGDSTDLEASTPPPPIGIISKPGSPPNSCTVGEPLATQLSNKYYEELLRELETEMTPSGEVSVMKPPSLEVGDMTEWTAFVGTMLPGDILRKAPRKRGQGKYLGSGQKYKPCSWEEFIERVNEKVNAGTLKVTKRPRRRRQIRDPEGVTDPVVVALQAHAEIYGEHFNAAAFGQWD